MNLVENQSTVGASPGVAVTGPCVLICTGGSKFGSEVLATIEMAASDNDSEYAPTSFVFRGPGVQYFAAPNQDTEYFLRSRLPRIGADTDITIRIVQ